MTRLWILLAADLFASTLAPAHSQDQDFSKVQMKVSKVAGNVYMLETLYNSLTGQRTGKLIKHN